jgi:hypothetical protein
VARETRVGLLHSQCRSLRKTLQSVLFVYEWTEYKKSALWKAPVASNPRLIASCIRTAENHNTRMRLRCSRVSPPLIHTARCNGDLEEVWVLSGWRASSTSLCYAVNSGTHKHYWPISTYFRPCKLRYVTEVWYRKMGFCLRHWGYYLLWNINAYLSAVPLLKRLYQFWWCRIAKQIR